MAILTAPQLRTALRAQFQAGKVRYSPSGMFGLGRDQGVDRLAIFGASHSPIDVTSIATDKAQAKYDEVLTFLREQEGVSVEIVGRDLAVFKVGGKKPYEFALSINRYPTYERSQNLDRGYQSSWVTLRFE